MKKLKSKGIKARLASGLLALLMLSGSLVACKDENVAPDAESASNTTAGTSTETDAVTEPVVLTVAEIKTSDTSSLGDASVALVDDEQVWEGLANNQTAHMFAVVLSKTAKITKIVIKTPVDAEDCDTLRSACLEASADGKEWVELKAMGTMLTPNKTYNITISNDTAFGYFRIRQHDNNMSQKFVLRYVQLHGIETNGAAPSVESLVLGSETAVQMITMKDVSVYQTNAGDPKNIFINNGLVWSGSMNLDRCHTVTATMSKKSVISQIKMVIPNPIAGTNKMDGTVIEASVDGESWTALATVEKGIQAGATYVYTVKDTTPYSYLRLRQSETRKGDGYDVPNFLVFGTPTSEETTVYPTNHLDGRYMSVATLETSAEAGGNKDLVWAERANQFWLGTMKEQTQHYIIGELPSNMRITRIVYRNTNQFLSRSRGSLIQVSNDKENWTTIVTLPTSPEDPLYPNKEAGYDASGEYREYYLELDQSYRYVRVIQASSLVGYYWTIGNINVYGVDVSAQ